MNDFIMIDEILGYTWIPIDQLWCSEASGKKFSQLYLNVIQARTTPGKVQVVDTNYTFIKFHDEKSVLRLEYITVLN